MSDNSETVINELLADFTTQRDALNSMIGDVEELKKNINNLFPEKLDARFQKFFEDKVKTAVSMLNVLLDIRKELIKLTKDEIELRRKVVGKGDLNDMLNIRSLAKQVETMNKHTTRKIESKKKKIEQIKECVEPVLEEN